jgi:hypothetical protein
MRPISVVYTTCLYEPFLRKKKKGNLICPLCTLGAMLDQNKTKFT